MTLYQEKGFCRYDKTQLLDQLRSSCISSLNFNSIISVLMSEKQRNLALHGERKAMWR
jgi:N-acetylglutamate synthase-like GNAT family acetyltransferase